MMRVPAPAQCSVLARSSRAGGWPLVWEPWQLSTPPSCPHPTSVARCGVHTLRCCHPFPRPVASASPQAQVLYRLAQRRPSLLRYEGGRNSAKKPGHFIDGRKPARLPALLRNGSARYHQARYVDTLTPLTDVDTPPPPPTPGKGGAHALRKARNSQSALVARCYTLLVLCGFLRYTCGHYACSPCLAAPCAGMADPLHRLPTVVRFAQSAHAGAVTAALGAAPSL